MEKTLKRDLRNYPLYFLIWMIIGVFSFSQHLSQKFFSHDPTPWRDYLVSELVGVYIWALLTPAIFWLGRWFPIERRNVERRVALHLLLGAIVSVAQVAIESAVLPHLGVFPHVMRTFGKAFALLVVIMFHNGFETYWAILGVQYGIRYYLSVVSH
jgi:polyferredoxin